MSTSQLRFEQVHAQTGSGLLAYFSRRVTTLADAADLVAETYLVIWRRIGDLPQEEDHARAWTYGVARGVLLNYQRGVRRRLALAERLRTALERESPASEPDSEVAAALERLSADDRELVTLIAWDGLTPRQAADVLGIEPGTLRVRLHRARAKARDCLDEGRALAPRHTI